MLSRKLKRVRIYKRRANRRTNALHRTYLDGRPRQQLVTEWCLHTRTLRLQPANTSGHLTTHRRHPTPPRTGAPFRRVGQSFHTRTTRLVARRASQTVDNLNSRRRALQVIRTHHRPHLVHQPVGLTTIRQPTPRHLNITSHRRRAHVIRHHLTRQRRYTSRHYHRTLYTATVSRLSQTLNRTLTRTLVTNGGARHRTRLLSTSLLAHTRGRIHTQNDRSLTINLLVVQRDSTGHQWTRHHTFPANTAPDTSGRVNFNRRTLGITSGAIRTPVQPHNHRHLRLIPHQINNTDSGVSLGVVGVLRHRRYIVNLPHHVRTTRISRRTFNREFSQRHQTTRFVTRRNRTQTRRNLTVITRRTSVNLNNAQRVLIRRRVSTMDTYHRVVRHHSP